MRKFLRATWRFITAPFRFIGWIIRSISRILSQATRKVKNFFTEEVEDTPISDTFAKSIENPMDLLYHLDALRKHLVRSVLALMITTSITFTFIRQILEFLSRPLEGGLQALKAIEVTENIGTVMRVSLLSGFALAFPYIITELWLFIAPGLQPRSRRTGILAIPIAILLFICGMAFTYFVMLPVALPFLFNFMGLSTEARPSSYFNFVSGILFWIGLAFEFPLAAYIMADFGIIRARALAEQWRVAIVVIAVLAAAITPTVDPVNMALVMGPMILLYFLSIALAFLAQRGRTNK